MRGSNLLFRKPALALLLNVRKHLAAVHKLEHKVKALVKKKKLRLSWAQHFVKSFPFRCFFSQDIMMSDGQQR